MIIPKFLRPGDAIYLLSTARSATRESVKPFVDWLENSGYRVILGKTIGPKFHQFAGDDAFRAADFNFALHHPDVKAIWCARGGYGSIRMLDMIDANAISQHPKWLIGFSDVTAIHGLFQREGVMSLHGFMAGLFEDTLPDAREQTLQVLTGGAGNDYWLKSVPQANAYFPDAVVFGGNLSMLYSMNGSDLLSQPEGRAALFIEDVDEYLYHIDRMMWAFRRSGYLQKFNYLLVGTMADMNDHDVPFGQDAREIIQSHADALNIPVYFDFPVGHQNSNFPLILGSNFRISE
ncbi:MAG: LD-carboxypeptidase [Cryomorphaceae bacterium]|nr:LD-carboxypeptidase [Cryomorphaceae bacterium]